MKKNLVLAAAASAMLLGLSGCQSVGNAYQSLYDWDIRGGEASQQPATSRVAPLVVPPDCGALKAAGEARAWQEGRLMMFDDSFEHEAWNDSDQTRVVLIFDTWNPHLSEIEREAFRRVLGTAQRFERAA